MPTSRCGLIHSHVLRSLLVVTLLTVAAIATSAQTRGPFEQPSRQTLDSSSYVERTGNEQIELLAREWRTESGFYLQSESSNGDQHVVLVDPDLRTRAWQFTSENDRSRVQAVRVEADEHAHDAVYLSGVVDGETVEGIVELGEPLWIQSIERSLRQFVLDGKPGDRIRFSVVQPDNLSARTLEARIMGDEVIRLPTDGLANGSDPAQEIHARRVRISLPGIGVIIWRSHYWFRLPDGLFVLSRVTRGPPGTPETVVELTDLSDPARE